MMKYVQTTATFKQDNFDGYITKGRERNIERERETK